MKATQTVIQAAGAVLWRRNSNGEIEIAVIHRPRYDDWSLPKGKVDGTETHLQAALREVREETGITGIFGPEIGSVTYEVGSEVKFVRYWSAQVSNVPVGPIDKNEVDVIDWLDINSAKGRLSLRDDRDMVDIFTEYGAGSTPIILLRHAKALKRESWDGDDGDRPLDANGLIQASKLAAIYKAYGVEEIHSSDAIRCIQTIEPMAHLWGIDPIFTQDISEYGYERDKEAALDYALDVMNSQRRIILCSHNPVLPKIVKKLIGKKSFKKLDESLKPGDAFVLHHRDGEIIAVDWIGSPALSGPSNPAT